MKIKKLQIKNFKSIVDLELINPNPFSVFVGPNASGKSNIFEAIEFINFRSNYPTGENAIEMFGGAESIFNYLLYKPNNENGTNFYLELENEPSVSAYIKSDKRIQAPNIGSNSSANFEEPPAHSNYLRQYFNNYSRIFINEDDKKKINYSGDLKLNLSCDNLEKVLKRLLQDEVKREEITEWIQLFIPGFEKIEIESTMHSGRDEILIFEKGTTKPFPKDLISDGTYNILCLLTACYQSDEPQFLCIEEPENGLNPFVIRELIHLFREKCDEGSYIWLNTHSQSLVSRLKEEEVVLVDKIDGATKVKQVKTGDTHGLRMDEAWFTKVLGGGTPF